MPWDGAAQGEFIASLCQDRAGRVFVGTEGSGVWRFDPFAPKSHPYTHYTVKDGLGDDDAYALACDGRNRIWCGHLSHGVSVFNGKSWKNYDRLTGPLSAHVTAIAVSPLDGDVWLAGDLGLARYSAGRDRWTYMTRADGLPSDQINALAFSQDGGLYVGTPCDGLAVGSSQDNYATWRVVSGPTQEPPTPTGDGLPSSLVNAVLVARDGAVYVGTTAGLAASRDGGKTWRYLRGDDWLAKAQGVVGGPPPNDNAPNGPRLLEDYVTCLAEGGAGQILVGHRGKGCEILDPATGTRLWPGGPTRNSAKPAPAGKPLPDYVTAILPLPGQPGLVGSYGQGLTAFAASAPSSGKVVGVFFADAAAPFPAPASAPASAELQTMLSRVQRATAPLPVGGAVFLGQDWATEGDWVGRYGAQYAIHCGVASPRDHEIVNGSHFYILRTVEFSAITDSPYAVFGQAGPHRRSDDHLRHWLDGWQTDDPSSMYDPFNGCRREAQWDDHGEDGYPPTQTGPDVWVTFVVPDGTHQISLYCFNPNGHNQGQSHRDYLIQVKSHRLTLADAERDPDLARARSQNFAGGGVYQRFVVRGPTTLLFRVNRNHSFNTILNGVFVDRLAPPTAPAASPSDPLLGASQALWSALDNAYDRRDATLLQEPYRLLAYRSAMQAGAPKSLLQAWHSVLHLWTPQDRQAFAQAMAQAWQTHLATTYPATHPFVTLLKQ